MGQNRTVSPHRKERTNRNRQRSRSRDRERERERNRSRERERERPRRFERDRRRSQSPSSSRRRRSRSPRRRHSRSPRRRSHEKDDTKGGAVPKFLMNRPQITEKDLEGKTEEEQEMMKMMGFGNFDTTKGKHVPGNDVYAVHNIQKRKYRQYMNRKGGFNRPLDFVA